MARSAQSPLASDGATARSQRPGLYTASAVLHLAVVLTGIAVAASAAGRERPEEIAGGVAIAVLGVALGIWAHSRRTPMLALATAIGAVVQVAALLYYFYSGFSVDAHAYHSAATVIADPDRELTGRFAYTGSAWSNFVASRSAAAVYQVFIPSQLLGFVAFSAVGLVAKIMFAHTLLCLRPLLGRPAELVALGVMVYPSLALWLAPIGKETYAILGVSLVIAGVARPVGRRPRIWLIALGIATAALTRPHVAMLLAVSVLAFVAVAFAIVTQSLARRVAILVGAALLAVAAVVTTVSFFDIDASLDGFGEVREGLAEIEDRGGSTIEARPLRGVVDTPFAIANVLLRPFLFEADSLTMLLQALETTLVLLLVLWLLTRGAYRRAHRVSGAARQHVRTLRAFGVTYLVSFVYAFSAMYNLGLMSRQRSQLILVILLLIALSMVSTRRGRRTPAPPLRHAGVAVSSETTGATPTNSRSAVLVTDSSADAGDEVAPRPGGAGEHDS